MSWFRLTYSCGCASDANWAAEFPRADHADDCPMCGRDGVEPIAADRLPDHDGWRLDGDRWWTRPARADDETRAGKFASSFVDNGWIFTIDPANRAKIDAA